MQTSLAVIPVESLLFADKQALMVGLPVSKGSFAIEAIYVDGKKPFKHMSKALIFSIDVQLLINHQDLSHILHVVRHPEMGTVRVW